MEAVANAGLVVQTFSREFLSRKPDLQARASKGSKRETLKIERNKVRIWLSENRVTVEIQVDDTPTWLIVREYEAV